MGDKHRAVRVLDRRLTAAGVAQAATRWRALPVLDARVPWRRLLSVASSLVAAVLAIVAVAG
ncbi:hypothetical protein [Micromonospora sp. NPDC005710]|uniref:hypothetical protein n=1 Tax=Micromonospora sp. NPDC005710 TaxID=3157051 RepID=UPI0033E90AA5